MENSSKAIVMAGQVLIFIIALSTGIFLYETLIATQDTILIASVNYTREAESFSNTFDFEREVYGSEIFGSVMSSMESTDRSAIISKNDYNPDIIKIVNDSGSSSGIVINLKKLKEDDALYTTYFSNIRQKINYNDKYRLSYNIGNDGTVTAVYTRSSD